MNQKERREQRALLAQEVADTHARTRVESLGKAELLEMILEVYDSCSKYQYEKDGIGYASPQHASALKALELAAKLLGLIGDGRQMSFEQLKQELNRMGWKLEPAKRPEKVG